MSAERYTAVFTGAFAEKKPGEYLYLTMSEDPLGSGGSHTLRRGRPPACGWHARSPSKASPRGAGP